MNADREVSLIGALRTLIPQYPISFPEALGVSERQAALLLSVVAPLPPPVPTEIVTDLPRVQVVHHPGASLSLSYWNGSTWIIALNPRDTAARRRFLTFHEFAHIVWHGAESRLRPAGGLGRLQAEMLADHFARSVLMPDDQLRWRWSHGVKDIARLTSIFGVSEYALLTRLLELQLWRARPDPRWWNQALDLASQIYPLWTAGSTSDDPEAVA